MKILIDTNILIDFLMKRPLFYDDARKVIQLCMNKKIEGCIAAHSVMNIFYILRKDFTTELAGATIIKSSGEGPGRFVSARNTQLIAFAEAEFPRFGIKDRLRGRIRLGTGHIDRHRDGMNFHAVLRVR